MELYPTQQVHVQNAINIFKERKCIIDTSVMGSGKTLTSCVIAKNLGLSLYVVGLKSTFGNWKNISNVFDVKLKDIITYQTLRSVKNVQPKHGLLRKSMGYFRVTDKYKDLCKEGVLIIFDESQNAKNDTAQYKACKALSKYICNEPETKSRVMFLSGTPFDKEEHSVQYINMMGFMKCNNLYEYDNICNVYKQTGLNELLTHANMLNPQKALEIQNNYPIAWNLGNKIVKSLIYTLVYNLFIEIYKPLHFITMPEPVLQCIRDIKNGYYTIENKEDLDDIYKGLEKLTRCIKEKENGKLDYNELTNALVLLENGKLNNIAKLTLNDLMCKDKNKKVVIFVNYKKSITRLQDLLRDYSPLILEGSTKTEDRARIMEEFQNPNNDHRVFIANTRCGGIGVSLHDTNGGFPRTTYIIPTFNIIDLHQAIFRTIRVGTKSLCTVRFVYAKNKNIDDLKELKLLTVLARKSVVMKSVLNEKVLLPIDYENDYESDYESDYENVKNVNKLEKKMNKLKL